MKKRTKAFKIASLRRCVPNTRWHRTYLMSQRTGPASSHPARPAESSTLGQFSLFPEGSGGLPQMPLPVWSFSAAENCSPPRLQDGHLKSTQRHSSFACLCFRILFHGPIPHCSSHTGSASKPRIPFRILCALLGSP